LLSFVRQNVNTWFGREHSFASIKSVRDFQDAVPLATYDHYRHAIDRIADGEQNVLTADRVRLLEPTGGSTTGEKLIPYTGTLQRCFQRAIRVWIWDLYSQRQLIRRGRSYWSISPLTQPPRRTKAGIPIGFDDDASYLSRFEKTLVQRTMAVPPDVARRPSVAAARYATLFHLLRARDLSLISVWSPTFLTELLNALWELREQLCDDLAAGQISFGSAAERSLLADRHYRPLITHAESIRHIVRGAEHVSQCVLSIWPSLAFVSCWADGPSAVQANYLRQYLSGIEIQPKGLLATEAFVTVPLLAHAAPALAIRSHFFEFQPASIAGGEDTSLPLLAADLIVGHRYNVIVTNGGGLYRYRLHDEVEVMGYKNEVPLLRFVGKTDDVSDIVGEKLHAAHVESVFQSAFGELELVPTFAQLRAELDSPARYVLQIVDTTVSESTTIQQRLCNFVENGLKANSGYSYARAMGQLRPIRIDILSQPQADAIISKRITDRVAAGQRHGAVKPATLCHPK
jgi:hypothetical protein